MKKVVAFISFYFSLPLDKPRPPLQSSCAARPGSHLNPSLSDRKPLPQQAQSGFLCRHISPYGKYLHALLNKLKVLFSHHFVGFSRKDIIFHLTPLDKKKPHN